MTTDGKIVIPRSLTRVHHRSSGNREHGRIAKSRFSRVAPICPMGYDLLPAYIDRQTGDVQQPTCILHKQIKKYSQTHKGPVKCPAPGPLPKSVSDSSSKKRGSRSTRKLKMSESSIRTSTHRIPIKDDHYLSRHGYKDVVKKSQAERRSILNSMIDTDLSRRLNIEESYHKIISSLSARSTLLKSRAPEASRRMKSNQRYMSRKLSQYKDTK